MPVFGGNPCMLWSRLAVAFARSKGRPVEAWQRAWFFLPFFWLSNWIEAPSAVKS